MNIPSPLRRRPALEGSARAILACALLAAGSAVAASAPRGSLGTLLACRDIPADAARLKCFDRTSAVLARATAAAPAASSPQDAATAGPPVAANHSGTPAGRRAAALDPRQTFGLSATAILAREVKSGARQKSISGITARITRLGAAPDGRMLYGLDNGQTWEEQLADGDAPPVKAGDSVRISRGWLDSYWMQTASGRGCKVQRLR